jgi:solute carrier family 25 iron transporter 28/37
MSAMVVGAGPSHALYFSSYEYLKNAMIKSTTTSRYHTAIYGKGPNPRCLSQG